MLITVADMRILDSFIHIHDKEKTANAHVQVVTRAFTHAHLQLHTHTHTNTQGNFVIIWLDFSDRLKWAVLQINNEPRETHRVCVRPESHPIDKQYALETACVKTSESYPPRLAKCITDAFLGEL